MINSPRTSLAISAPLIELILCVWFDARSSLSNLLRPNFSQTIRISSNLKSKLFVH